MKKYISLILALFLVLGAKAQTPEGYNENDFEKLKAFMEQSAFVENGNKLHKVINAQILLGPEWFYSWDYEAEVWLKFLESRSFHENRVVEWIPDPEVDNSRRLKSIDFSWITDKPEDTKIYLSGSLDFEGCTYLTQVVCCEEKLTSVNLKGCENLEWVDLHDNTIKSINIEGCNSIDELHIYNNKLLPSKIIFSSKQPEKINFGYQQVQDGSIYASVCERKKEIYLVVNLQHELYCIQPDFFYQTCWDKNINIEYDDPPNGIYYVKLDYIQNLTSSITVDLKTQYWGIYGTDQENERCVNYTFDIAMGTITIDTYPQTSNAMASTWWLGDGNYILVDIAKARDTSPYIMTNSLPQGNYIVQVVADGYLSTFYSGQNDSPDISWKDERVMTVSTDDFITVYLKKNPVLKDDKITIRGILEQKKTKSSLKASARVLQRTTVTLHTSSEMQKATTEWILVATTQTDENGAYTFTNLPAGPYRITVEIPGYYESESIIVQASSSGTIFGNQNFIVDEEARTITANGEKIIISEYLMNDEIQLSVYPNPAADVVHIAGLEGAYNVKIINMTGQIVQSMNGTSPELTLYLNDFPSGMYLLRIESQVNVRMLKFIKNN